jgi:hypothetical protein
MATLDRLEIKYNPEELFQAHAELVGGEKNLTAHDLETRHCGHMKSLEENPTIFGLKPEEVKFIIDRFIDSSTQKYELPGEHSEPEAIITVGGGVAPINKFTFTEDLVHEGEQKLAQILVDEGYVQLPKGMSVEDLSNELFNTLETHFNLIVKKLAAGKELWKADLSHAVVNAVLLGIL